MQTREKVIIIAAIITATATLLGVLITKYGPSPAPSIVTATQIPSSVSDIATATPIPLSEFEQKLASFTAVKQWTSPLNAQDNQNWGGSSCSFTNAAYVVSTQQSMTEICFARNPSISLYHFAFEVQMDIVSGNSGGVAFGDPTGIQYLFSVDHTGVYNLWHYPNHATNKFICDAASNSDYCSLKGPFTYGTGNTNTLGVIVHENQIYLYVNRHLIFSPKFSDLPDTGSVGVMAIYAGDSVVAFNNATLWSIS